MNTGVSPQMGKQHGMGFLQETCTKMAWEILDLSRNQVMVHYQLKGQLLKVGLACSPTCQTS
jgi:hypothetical protein